MLVWLTLPFYNFCGFRSVAVNSVYKLQFFTFMLLETAYRMAPFPMTLRSFTYCKHFTMRLFRTVV